MITRSLDKAIQQLDWDRLQVFVVSDGPLDEPPENSFPGNPVKSLSPGEWAQYQVEGTQGQTTLPQVTYDSPTARAQFPEHRNVRIRAERLYVRAFR